MDAVSAVPGAMLAVTIPASDIEVGGTNGQEALQRLQNIVRRVGDAVEGGDRQGVVRDRAPPPVRGGRCRPGRPRSTRSPAGSPRSTATSRGEFPSRGCASSDYEDDIRAAYPIHPELFQRLYDDWSTLGAVPAHPRRADPAEHRDPGALGRQGPSPMIMPATLPLSAYRRGQPARPVPGRHLGDRSSTGMSRAGIPPPRRWTDPSALRAAVGDRAARAHHLHRLGRDAAAPNKGIEKQRIWLGTAVPGDTTGHFDSALHLLAERATYLYTEGDRYWYDVVAVGDQDRAGHRGRTDRRAGAGLPGDRRPTASSLPTEARSSFAGVPVLPDRIRAIPDEDEARLVLIHPEHTHKRGDAELRRDGLRPGRDPQLRECRPQAPEHAGVPRSGRREDRPS